MNTSELLAKHLRDVYFGGNWTDVNLKEVVSDVSWKEATHKVANLNTIATLVFHINYFIDVGIRVLEKDILEGSDKLSFDHPPINSEGDWQKFLDNIWSQGNKFADLIEKFPENRLSDEFFDPKYADYYKNFQGIIEHTHYHLGQISLIKKLIRHSP